MSGIAEIVDAAVTDAGAVVTIGVFVMMLEGVDGVCTGLLLDAEELVDTAGELLGFTSVGPPELLDEPDTADDTLDDRVLGLAGVDRLCAVVLLDAEELVDSVDELLKLTNVAPPALLDELDAGAVTLLATDETEPELDPAGGIVLVGVLVWKGRVVRPPEKVTVAVVTVLKQIGAFVTVSVTPGAIVMMVFERTDVWTSYGMRLTVTSA